MKNTSKVALYRGITVSGAMTALSIPLAFADATSTATALGTGVGSFMDTLTSVSLQLLTNSTLISAMVIAGIVFSVLYWIKGKFL